MCSSDLCVQWMVLRVCACFACVSCLDVRVRASAFDCAHVALRLCVRGKRVGASTCVDTCVVSVCLALRGSCPAVHVWAAVWPGAEMVGMAPGSAEQGGTRPTMPGTPAPACLPPCLPTHWACSAFMPVTKDTPVGKSNAAVVSPSSLSGLSLPVFLSVSPSPRRPPLFLVPP